MASMIDAFLKIPEIPGESQDTTHAGEFDLQSFSLAVSQSGSMAIGGGGGVGQVGDGKLVAQLRKDRLLVQSAEKGRYG